MTLLLVPLVLLVGVAGWLGGWLLSSWLAARSPFIPPDVQWKVQLEGKQEHARQRAEEDREVLTLFRSGEFAPLQLRGAELERQMGVVSSSTGISLRGSGV